jgi:hypothetical protein
VIEVLNVFGILGLRNAVENALVADTEIDSLDVYRCIDDRVI